jgi:hypothetical protein
MLWDYVGERQEPFPPLGTTHMEGDLVDDGLDDVAIIELET